MKKHNTSHIIPNNYIHVDLLLFYPENFTIPKTLNKNQMHSINEGMKCLKYEHFTPKNKMGVKRLEVKCLGRKRLGNETTVKRSFVPMMAVVQIFRR